MVNNNKVGIVIVNYNRGRLVAEISRKFSEYESIDKIVIVDNNSIDDSPQVFTSLTHEKIHCLLLRDNRGYARGNNAGLKLLNKIGCNICFIVNPDVFLQMI